MNLTTKIIAASTRDLLRLVTLMALLVCTPGVFAGKISLSIQELDILEVMQMLSREQRMNIFVADGVSGNVSVNLYDMETAEAVNLIAESAGFVVEQRNNSFFVLEREDAGKLRQSDRMEVRSFKVQYAAISDIETILQDYISNYGSIKSLQENDLLIIEDLPPFLDKIEIILAEIDQEPKQFLIEAKILEISLTDSQSYGLDWALLFDNASEIGSFGTRGLASRATAGLFGQYTNGDVDLVLSALKERGRLRTISTPKLLAMEGQEASSVVGTEIGYRVTTTINQVTTESIEFLEAGIILKVIPTVDRNGRITLDIFPEVSTAVVSDDGIPSVNLPKLVTRITRVFQPFMFNPILPWSKVSKRIMGSFFVVFSYPVFREFSHFAQCFKDVHVQYLVTIGAVESLDIRVLGRFARFDKLEFNVVLFRPFSQCC